MQIVNMKITDVHPYEKNPRFNDDAVDAVAKSISEFGWRSPIVVDKDRVIVCGHTRFKAAQKLGLAEVPVHVAADLTPEQIQAYRIADNKTAEIAEWNYDLLPLEIRELQDADFDLSLLGFDTDELDRLLNGTDADAVADGETEPDAVPDVPEEAASRRGTLYRLGEHLLLCGDATKPEDIARLTGDDKANLYLVDPPYNVALTGSNGLTIQNDNMADEKFREFLTAAFRCASDSIEPGASFYVFHSDSESSNFRLAARDAGLEVHETLYWVKNSFVLGRFDYHYQSESVLYGWTPGAPHSWYSDRCQTNILSFDKPKHNDVHPSMKPVEMLVYLVKNSSKRGETVLDNFGGSGSTLIACEQTGRKCRMIELDEKYCDVIRRRWAEFVHGEGCDWKKLTPAVENQTEGENTNE
ncbi:MAG: DNA modification methylase [Smithellaceae bacterium]